MRRKITYNGTSNLDIPCYITSSAIHKGPVPDYGQTEIPGRNGDLIYSYERYGNVELEYGLAVRSTEPTDDPTDLRDKADAIKDWLYPCSDSYYRLIDNCDPGYYRMAQYTGGFTLDNFLMRFGKGTITFNCKPQRYLEEGDTAIELSAEGTVTNPTKYDALPLIRVYTTEEGTLTVGSVTVKIAAGATEYIDIDSDTHRIYEGTNSRSSLITLTEHAYPVLHAGDNGVSFTGGVTKVQITPRWWKL